MSNEVKRYGVSGPDWEVDEEPDGEFALWSDYAALEAECSRLRESLKDADAGMVLFMGQRNELAAELAAIRAAGVEVVEVVGYKFTANRDANETFLSKDGGFFAHHTNEPLMTVAQHQRIVAAMAAERAVVIDTRNGVVEECNALHDANAELRAELEAARKQEPAAWVAKGNITELKRAKEPTWVQAWNKDRHGRVALYALPPLAGQVGVPRELLAKWLVHVEARERQYEEIYTEGDKLRALLATPSMEVKS